jgi:hypothetical protein
MLSSGDSNRTRALLTAFRIVALLWAVVVLGLVANLVGSIALGWKAAPVPQMAMALVYAAFAAIVLRAALSWSTGRDRRDNG